MIIKRFDKLKMEIRKKQKQFFSAVHSHKGHDGISSGLKAREVDFNPKV